MLYVIPTLQINTKCAFYRKRFDYPVHIRVYLSYVEYQIKKYTFLFKTKFWQAPTKNIIFGYRLPTKCNVIISTAIFLSFSTSSISHKPYTYSTLKFLSQNACTLLSTPYHCTRDSQCYKNICTCFPSFKEIAVVNEVL